MSIENATDDSFKKDVIDSPKPVVVDFWAEWCGPCKMITPILEEIASEMNEKIKVVKLNIDENPNTATKYGVRSIPTLMLFKGGEMIGTQVGAAPKGKLIDWINTSA